MTTTLTAQLAAIMARDLRAARREIEAYPDEATVWKVASGTMNPGGSLARHLAGNLRHFIGAVLGSNGYVRDRDAEFSATPVPRAQLLGELDAAVETVETTLPTLSAEVLNAPFPAALGGHTLNTQDFLIHLTSHLGYHLGQIDYHRRIVTGDATTVGAQTVAELSSARKG